MDMYALLNSLDKPELYAKGSHVMWTDPHMAEQLQSVHLDPEQDLASRKPDSIRRTLEWIETFTGGKPCDILELGCGPGLYTQRLAQSGHRVTGLDFSERSLKTAQERAVSAGLQVRYVQGDYLSSTLTASLPDHAYDVVMIIYTDFGVLSPVDQATLLASIRRALKPGGLFLFDVLYPKAMKEKMGGRQWEAVPSGYWSAEPYLALSQSIPYLESRAFLNQTLVWTGGEIKTYRFWVRFYDEKDIGDLLSGAGFTLIHSRRDVLGDDGLWNGDHVMFCAAQAPDE